MHQLECPYCSDIIDDEDITPAKTGRFENLTVSCHCGAIIQYNFWCNSEDWKYYNIKMLKPGVPSGHSETDWQPWKNGGMVDLPLICWKGTFEELQNQEFYFQQTETRFEIFIALNIYDDENIILNGNKYSSEYIQSMAWEAGYRFQIGEVVDIEIMWPLEKNTPLIIKGKDGLYYVVAPRIEEA